MTPELTVHVVDDDAAIRDALRLLLKSSGMRVETYASAEQFLGACRPPLSGCLLVDVRMPDMSGLELQERLATHGIRLPVIVITGHGDIAMAVRAMKAGAVDFIEKPFDNAALLACLRSALARAADARRHEMELAEMTGRLARLTHREREVMAFLVAGKSNKVIAAGLEISTRTVEVHRAKIMEKLEARSLADVVRIALASTSTN